MKSTRKLTIEIRADLLKFVEEYCKIHGIKNRSQVIEKAIALLHEEEMESDSREAADDDELLSGLPIPERLMEKDE
ncbi:MAG: hypothetical protein ACREUV_08275 [Burkholderiales bacterium]